MWDLIVSVPGHCLSFYFLYYIHYTCNQQEFDKLHFEPCFQIMFEVINKDSCSKP